MDLQGNSPDSNSIKNLCSDKKVVTDHHPTSVESLKSTIKIVYLKNPLRVLLQSCR